MEKLAELRRKLGALTDNLTAAVEDPKEFARIEGEITTLEATIARAEAAQKRNMGLARPVGDAPSTAISEDDLAEFGLRHAQPFGLRDAGALSRGNFNGDLDAQWNGYVRKARQKAGFRPDASKHFRTFGEQLQAVAQYSLSRGSTFDNRLVRAPTGAGEVDPTGGGFLVQTDFQEAVFMLAHDMGELLSRVNKIPISGNANGLKINAVDETSRATGSRWGGVQSYWVNEGDTVTKTKPKFRRLEFDLHKLFSIAYVTDELLQDSTALMAVLGQAFSEEIMFMTELGIMSGSGAGLPLGVLNSPALITVPKVNGQLTQTIVRENIDAMWSRLWGRSQKQSVWFINQFCLPQLFELNQAVGTGGQLVFNPPGGLSEAPYATLFGRPVVITEYNPFTGTPGDILLADMSQYTIVDKGGVQAATSMHVAFLTDEMAFRITYRVDGKPMWVVPLTAFQGGSSNLTVSPFVALATR